MLSETLSTCSDHCITPTISVRYIIYLLWSSYATIYLSAWEILSTRTPPPHGYLVYKYLCWKHYLPGLLHLMGTWYTNTCAENIIYQHSPTSWVLGIQIPMLKTLYTSAPPPHGYLVYKYQYWNHYLPALPYLIKQTLSTNTSHFTTMQTNCAWNMIYEYSRPSSGSWIPCAGSLIIASHEVILQCTDLIIPLLWEVFITKLFWWPSCDYQYLQKLQLDVCQGWIPGCTELLQVNLKKVITGCPGKSSLPSVSQFTTSLSNWPI